MSTNSLVKTDRSFEHYDPNSEVKRRDSGSRKEYRNSLVYRRLYDLRLPDDFKFPTVEEGLKLNRKGTELTAEQHRDLYHFFRENRSKYLGRRKRKKDGEIVPRLVRPRTTIKIPALDEDGKKIKIKKNVYVPSLRQQVLTFCPAHAIGLSFLDRKFRAGNDMRRDQTKNFLKQLATDFAGEFEGLTNYEVYAMEVHAQDGNLHFHIQYTTIDKDKNLLHPNKGIGRKGCRNLGFFNTAVLRIAAAGLPFDEEAIELAEYYLERKQKDNRKVIDWELSKLLDDAMENAVASTNDPEIKECFDLGWEKWEGHIAQKFNDTPAYYQLKLKEAEKKIAQLEQKQKDSTEELRRIHLSQRAAQYRQATLRRKSERDKKKQAAINRGRAIVHRKSVIHETVPISSSAKVEEISHNTQESDITKPVIVEKATNPETPREKASNITRAPTEVTQEAIKTAERDNLSAESPTHPVRPKKVVVQPKQQYKVPPSPAERAKATGSPGKGEREKPKPQPPPEMDR